MFFFDIAKHLSEISPSVTEVKRHPYTFHKELEQ